MDLSRNQKALFDYDLLEKYEAGLVLTGQEVKSVKDGHLSLKGAFVTFHNNDAFLTGASITKYKHAGPLPDYDPDRSRKLLLKRRQIEFLREKALEQGLTVVPIRVYTKNRLIKLEIAVARGRHKYDKREVLKKRDTDREMSRARKGGVVFR